MSKFSNFARIAHDFYETPEDAVKFLNGYLPNRPFNYFEPCVGNGKLIAGLAKQTKGVCVGASDAYPEEYAFMTPHKIDATCFDSYRHIAEDFEYFITNPPWTRTILHQIIIDLSNQKPTWLLFDSDWCFTKQAKPFRDRLRLVVPTYRIKWKPDSPHNSKYCTAWYLFDYPDDFNVPKIMIGY